MTIHPRHTGSMPLMRRLSWTVNALLNRAVDVVRHGRHIPSAGRLILIDPKAIKGRADLSRRPTWKHLGTVIAGDWDLHPLEFKSSSQRYLEYFQEGRTQTAREHLRQQLLDRGVDPTDADSRIEHCDTLYDSIRRNGFQPFIRTGNVLHALLPLCARGFTPNGVSAINVAVARNGDLLWVGLIIDWLSRWPWSLTMCRQSYDGCMPTGTVP